MSNPNYRMASYALKDRPPEDRDKFNEIHSRMRRREKVSKLDKAFYKNLIDEGNKRYLAAVQASFDRHFRFP